MVAFCDAVLRRANSGKHAGDKRPVYLTLASFERPGGAGSEGQERLKEPLLPHCCAMALLPLAAQHLAPAPLRHLMEQGQIHHLYRDCE